MDIKKILFRTNTIDVEKALPDGIVFCNKDGKIQWVNDKAAEVFETSRMHLLTSNISDFIENALNLISSSVILNKPVITKLVSGEVYFDMTTKEIEDGYVLSFRDSIPAEEISPEIKKIEDCTEINMNKNNFLLKLSNDLKSPLQSIVGFSQAMSDGLGGKISEQQEKYIRIIKKNSSELMYFVTKLLELSQTESYLPEPEYKTFDILNQINSIIRFNEQLYKGKDIRWKVNTTEDIKTTIISDENLTKSIIQDVIEVILKAVEMGDVCVELSVPEAEYIHSINLPDREYIQITLSSSSLLLSESDLDSMFDPYKILDTSNRKNVLRAIVLASVKNIVQALEGYIWVESKILKNTSFNIILPADKK